MENAPHDKKRRSKAKGFETKIESVNEASAGRLGHILMTAGEKAPINHTGQSALEAVRRSAKNLEKSTERLRQVPDKRVETLSRVELLSLSEKIMVDGSSLRQIYETHLVGERGLRRLVDEYLRGGDLKKALRQEIIEREIDFERDPAVRDLSAAHDLSISRSATGKSGKAALDKLLEKATADVQDSNEETAFFKARALYEAQQLQRHKQHRRLVDTGLTVTIAILIALVIVLLLRR